MRDRRLLEEFALGSLALLLLAAVLVHGRDAVPRAHPDAPVQLNVSPPIGDALASSAPPIASYTFNVELDPASHRVSGVGSMKLRNVSETPLGSIWLHLYLNAFEHRNTVFHKTASTGFRGNEGVLEPGSIEVTSFRSADGAELWSRARFPEPHDRTDVEIPLARPIAPGETATFEVAFDSKLPEIVLRTGYAGSFHMVGQWFPKFAKLEASGEFAHFSFERYSEFYADFGDYDVTITVPEGLTTVATGREVSRSQADGRTTSRFVQTSVIDFAFAAWDGFDLRSTTTAAGVSITCAFPKGMDREAAIELDAATRGLSFFGDAYGAYPYETLTIVHPPANALQAGGMEYPTLITTGLSAPPILGVRDLEVVTLHELAHQWFMGLVATNEHAWPFLDEGITSYATGRAMDVLYPDGLAPRLGFPVSLDALERMVQLGAHDAAPIASRASRFPTGRDYGALVYQRTATIMRTLDRVYDGAGERAVADYARTHRFSHPGPEALAAAVGRAVGRAEANEASAFFRGAIFERKSLDYAIEAIPVGSSEVTIVRRGELRLPTVIHAIDERGNEFRVPVAADAIDLPVHVPNDAPLVTVCVDPDRRLLIDEHRSNDCASHSSATLAPRTAALVSATLAAVLGVAVP